MHPAIRNLLITTIIAAVIFIGLKKQLDEIFSGKYERTTGEIRRTNHEIAECLLWKHDDIEDRDHHFPPMKWRIIIIIVFVLNVIVVSGLVQWPLLCSENTASSGRCSDSFYPFSLRPPVELQTAMAFRWKWVKINLRRWRHVESLTFFRLALKHKFNSNEDVFKFSNFQINRAQYSQHSSRVFTLPSSTQFFDWLLEKKFFRKLIQNSKKIRFGETELNKVSTTE